tara:strand:- start:155401 stop:156597 length:1197 start_codon:yes stop_codon:yes gene_type:complete
MKHHIAVITLLAAFSPSLFAIDADSFFLLDVEDSCISTKELMSGEKKEYQQSPDILPENSFIIFKPQKDIKSDITNINTLQEKVEDFFEKKNIAPADINNEIMQKITPHSLIQILKSALQDNDLLEAMAKRSYIHVMGFTKIVLLVGPKDKNYKVRLHLWWPNKEGTAQKLILEDKHVHKWDFASKMFSGGFEDQLYVTSDVREGEKLSYIRLTEKLSKLPKEEQDKIYNSLSAIENAMYGKSKFQKKKFRCSIDKKNIYTKNEIIEKLDLSEKDFIDILSVHESYVTMPNISGEYGLKKVGLKHLSFPVIYDIDDGYGYFHRHNLSHRLMSDPDDMVATLVITYPPIDTVEPYILMRSEEGEDITKVAPILTKERLIEQITRFIKYMEDKNSIPNKP